MVYRLQKLTSHIHDWYQRGMIDFSSGNPWTAISMVVIHGPPLCIRLSVRGVDCKSFHNKNHSWFRTVDFCRSFPVFLLRRRTIVIGWQIRYDIYSVILWYHALCFEIFNFYLSANDAWIKTVDSERYLQSLNTALMH